MHDLNGALFLKISFLFLVSASLTPSTVIVPFVAIHAALKKHKSGFNIQVSNLIFLLKEHWLLDKSFTLIHFFVKKFDTVKWSKSLDIF